jgi:acetyl-CoA synthetase
MTHGFWQDRERYLESYWSEIPDTWVHGDLARLNSNGSWLVVGRSDDTIKLAGKRVGSAEIESALVSHPTVVEAAVIGVPDESKGQGLACFVVLDNASDISQPSEMELARWLIDRLGKPFTPKRIIAVIALPKTRTGKVMRRAIRARYLGLKAGDLTTLEDESSLTAIPESHDAVV